MREWILVDWAVALYTVYTAVIILAGRQSVPCWSLLLLLHMALLIGMHFLPPRGATWELSTPDEPQHP